MAKNAGPKSRTPEGASKGSRRSEAASAMEAAITLPSPDWKAVAARPAARVRECLFYLLDVRAGDARRAGIHEADSEHPLAIRYNELLKVVALQMVAGNPCLRPLTGEPTMDRDDLQGIWISLSHFVALVKSPLSPFHGLVEPPEGLTALVVSPSFIGAPPAEAVATYEKLSGRRPPSPLPTVRTRDASEPFFDPPLPLPLQKGERYVYPTLGLLAELLEEIARGDRESKTVLDGDRLNAKAVGEMLQEMAASMFPKSREFVKDAETMAKHISKARKRLKTGDFQ